MLSLSSSCRGDVPKMWANYCRILQNVHFRLTCIAEKSLCSPWWEADMNRDTLSKSPLFFPPVGCAILKDFSYLFRAKFAGRKFYRWRHDNWPIGQWVTFHSAPDKAYVNHFFPAWIYSTIHIHSGKTSRPQGVVARSLVARPHALKLASLTFKNLSEVDL